MVEEVLRFMAPRSGGRYCDGTIGAGGHAEAILEASAPDGILVGIDRDPEAVKKARERLDRFGPRARVFHGSYAQADEVLGRLGIEAVDGMLLDLGVSSLQLDTPERGFSFRDEGLLDMRFDRTSGTTLEALLESIDDEDLASALKRHGEVRGAGRVARRIKSAVREGRIRSTSDLAREVHGAVGRDREGRIDSATQVFQALRIAVNDELGELEAVLDKLPSPLARGGRMVVLSFHSLEDRMAKNRFALLSRPCRCAPAIPQCVCGGPLMKVLSKKPVRPTAGEVGANPRSRSVRLRAAERL